MKIEIKKVDISNLPKQEVLCACFQKGFGFGEFIVGYIHIDNSGLPACETEYEILKPVTHYAQIKHLKEHFI